MLIFVLAMTLLRGVCRAEPPVITGISRIAGRVILHWDQPTNRFIVERSPSLTSWSEQALCVASSTGALARTITFPESGHPADFFRLKFGLQVIHLEDLFPDHKLAELVQRSIPARPGPTNAVYDTDLALITEIRGLRWGLNSLAGVEVLTNLEVLVHSSSFHQLRGPVDLSANTKLKTLILSMTGLTGIDLSHNTGLTRLDLRYSLLQDLDLTANTNLTTIDCYSNYAGPLTNLCLPATTNLTSLYCHWNKLTELDMSRNPNLRFLYCGDNLIRELRLSANVFLERLSCHDNPLGQLDLSANGLLQNLICDDCELASLEVSHCAELRLLYCGNNQLTELDLSGNPWLELLRCENNRLTTLDVSANTNLSLVYAVGNPLAEVIVWDTNNPPSMSVSGDPVIREPSTTNPAFRDQEVSKP